jgi:predicted metalloprotease
MRWRGRRQSTNVEDRRGQRVARRVAGGAGLANLFMLLLTRGSGKTRIVVILVILAAALIFKMSPLSFMGAGGDTAEVVQEAPPPNDEMRAFLATLKADNEEVWTRLFQEQGMQYSPARLVIYSDLTPIPGGLADARVGPFYLPVDKTVYIDPQFFDELSRRFGATGDFAIAYVVAHEIGHHVQNLLGISDQVQVQRGRLTQEEYNRLSVRLELQADYFAGVFAHYAERQFQALEPGDIKEAMECAEAIGDDTLQRRAQGRVVPDSFTHGTSEQRMRWFMKGYRSGRIEDGDTFNVPYDQL